jgi:predicted amidohydrolase YtcJ
MPIHNSQLDTLHHVKPFAIIAILIASATATLAQSPDTIYIHGNILTGTHLRPDVRPIAAAGTPQDLPTLRRLPEDPLTPNRTTALAISKGIITAVGNDATILALKTPQTKIIDLNGAFAMPGFNDAHTHIAAAGQQKLTIDLDNVPSLGEMQKRIRDYAASAPQGSWLQGAGWDHTKWPSKTLPTRQDIDAVSAGHPAILSRTDGHILVANTAALAAAHITRDTPDPPGGKIDRDAAGEPTGIVREDPAMSLIFKIVPPPSPELRRKALLLAISDALTHGVTSVQDFSDWEDFQTLEALEKSGELHLRVAEWLAFNTPVETLKQRQASRPLTDTFLHTTMLKGFMDGSLGSRTAALNAPYSDDPNNSGIPRYDQTKLNAMAKERAEAGFQLGFHAIGDRANDMALDAFEQALPSRHNAFDQLTVIPRYRIEHAQVVSPGAFDRFAKLHVIASMQPSHLLTDMNWAEARLGPERAKYSYAWRSFLDHNVVLAFGTDYPVESVNPFRGLYAAVTRQNEAGTKTYQPQEKITLNEALYAYTQASAYAENEEKLKGRLEPGYLADFVVLDRDITKATPQELLHTQVLRTVVNGETVYNTPKIPPATH